MSLILCVDLATQYSQRALSKYSATSSSETLAQNGLKLFWPRPFPVTFINDVLGFVFLRSQVSILKGPDRYNSVCQTRPGATPDQGNYTPSQRRSAPGLTWTTLWRDEAGHCSPSAFTLMSATFASLLIPNSCLENATLSLYAVDQTTVCSYIHGQSHVRGDLPLFSLSLSSTWRTKMYTQRLIQIISSWWEARWLVGTQHGCILQKSQIFRTLLILNTLYTFHPPPPIYECI